MKIGRYIDGLYGVQSTLNLPHLRKNADEMYEIIKDRFENDKSDYSGQSTLTTRLFSRYNLLMYPFPIIHDLYFDISNAFHLAYKSQYNRKANERFFIQCWLNYYKKGEYIDWHGHQPKEYGAWHGFFCVDVEPGSYTSYKWPTDPTRTDLVLDVQSKNGLIVMGLSNGDMHRSSEWNFEDKPRITIAFDIIPANAISINGIQILEEPRYLNAMRNEERGIYYTNHWIPI